MRLLVISAHPLFPIIGGYELRKVGLLAPLAARHELSLWYIGSDPSPEEAAQLAELFSEVRAFPPIELPPVPRPGVINRINQVLRGDPERYWDLAAHDFGLLAALQEGARAGRWDRVLATGWRVMPYVEQGLAGIPVAYDICDAPSLARRRALREKRGPALRTGLADWWMTRRLEREVLSRIAHAILISSNDAEAFGGTCRGPELTVIGNGVDLSYFDRRALAEAGIPTVVFSGVMSYEPNAKAAVWFAHEVWPLVRREVANARFIVVGRHPTDEVKALGEIPGITVTGSVPDVRPYLERAQVVVAPLRSGAGVKNKVLEAWAMGRPVVGTPIAFEGIVGAEAGTHYLLGERSAELATHVVHLLCHEADRRRMGDAGRALVASNSSWEASAAELERLLVRIGS